jgi:hypothetical protein
MADKIKPVSYTPAHKQPIIDLLDSKPFKHRIWDWQFTDNAHSGQFDPVVLADRWGTVAGFNGTMPVRIKFNDGIVQGLWSCDFIVDHRYHGMGFGRVIKQELHKRAPLIMALGISDMAAPVLLRMGWQKNNIVDSFRKLNRVTDVKSALIFLLQLVNRATSVKKNRDLTSSDLFVTDTLPAAVEVDRLWNRVCGTYKKIVIRDHAYLHWRYEQHPLAAYRFVYALQGGELAAMIVVRITGTSAYLTDYLGPAVNYDLKAALLEKFLEISASADSLSCATSDPEWKQLLHDYGFYRQQSKQRFYIYAAPELKPDSLSDWFIMGGDSDGEILRASEEGPFKSDYAMQSDRTTRFTIRTLGEDEFLAAAHEWDDLVARSDIDPLFMGWVWQSLWWKVWGKRRGYSLYLLAAYTEGNQLAGLAPFYSTTVKLHPLYQFTQLQFIGSSWNSGETVRSEYLDFIVDKHYASEVRKLFLDYLDKDKSWDQLILADMNRNCQTRKMLAQRVCIRDSYTRVVQNDAGISIDVSGSFPEYISAMGSNTRYSAFNQRKFLDRHGTVRLDYADASTSDSYLDRLNELHALRWGKPCFPPLSLQFHKQLARGLGNTGNLSLSMITVADKPVSVLYDIRMGTREYNIQAGFNTNFDRKLSPGFLHLGYAIESAFADPRITVFDLLAGAGKNTFYKAHFGSLESGFITLQINRAGYIRFLYKLYDSLPDRIKSLVKQRLLGRTRRHQDA